MKTVSVAAFVAGVNSIYIEQPSYELGHDGSDGKCDCIGMVRGALKRAGASDVKGLSGTNYAARYTIKNLRKIESVNDLRVGDVVLKSRAADDSSLPLPDRYRKGGADFNGDLTNYTHIGTVTKTNPLEITHMTTPAPQIDKKIGNWKFCGALSWVDRADPEPEPEPTEPETATVWAESGKTVKMRAKPSTSCRTYWEIPIGEQVIVDYRGETWSQITARDRMGWMMTKFLEFCGVLYTVIVPALTHSQADALVMQFPGAFIEEERG